MAETILMMDNIHKSFGDNHVLKGISLHVDQGEVVSVIGSSGGGKSTLLRCATLLETIDKGTLAYMGDVVAQETDGKLQYARDLKKFRSEFGLVFQQFNLFPHFSVLKNLMDAPVRVQKREKNEVRDECMELLKKMGLEQKAAAYPCELSGGQQQRVAIARALAMKSRRPLLTLSSRARF